jgi:hypothetical protein
MKTVVRKAEPRDLPHLARWFAKGLDRLCRRDQLLQRGPGDPEPYLAGMLRAPMTRVVVLEVEGTIAGYLIASLERFAGPPPPRRSRLARLLRRRSPAPLLEPIRILWIVDILLDRQGRQADGARELARWVAQWAKEQRVHRLGGSIDRDNLPAKAFAAALGLEPRREVYCRDIPDPDQYPEFPERPLRDMVD